LLDSDSIGLNGGGRGGGLSSSDDIIEISWCNLSTQAYNASAGCSCGGDGGHKLMLGPVKVSILY
jgi:hypothetical protein